MDLDRTGKYWGRLAHDAAAAAAAAKGGWCCPSLVPFEALCQRRDQPSFLELTSRNEDGRTTGNKSQVFTSDSSIPRWFLIPHTHFDGKKAMFPPPEEEYVPYEGLVRPSNAFLCEPRMGEAVVMVRNGCSRDRDIFIFFYFTMRYKVRRTRTGSFLGE